MAAYSTSDETSETEIQTSPIIRSTSTKTSVVNYLNELRNLITSSHFQSDVDKATALQYAKQLRDMSTLITSQYQSDTTKKPQYYTCGAGYQSTDDKEKSLSVLMTDVIKQEMELPSAPKKKDLFHYMFYSTINHLFQCKDVSFSPEDLKKWMTIYHESGFEAVLPIMIQNSTAGDTSSEAIDGHSVPATTIKRELKIDELFKLLKNKSSDWNRIGRGLGVPFNFRDELENKGSYSDEDRLERVLHKWKESRHYDCPWEKVLKMLKELELNDVWEDVSRYIAEQNLPHKVYVH